MVAPTHAIAGPEAHDHEVTAMAPGPTIDGPQRSEYSVGSGWSESRIHGTHPATVIRRTCFSGTPVRSARVEISSEGASRSSDLIFPGMGAPGGVRSWWTS